MTSAEQKVFEFLDRNGSAHTAAFIAKRLGIPRSTVQKALTKLRNANKVERDLDPSGYLWYA